MSAPSLLENEYRNRLPTLLEVLGRRTLAPVDLFSFYIYMRDQQCSVDYLDFWYAFALLICYANWITHGSYTIGLTYLNTCLYAVTMSANYVVQFYSRHQNLRNLTADLLLPLNDTEAQFRAMEMNSQTWLSMDVATHIVNSRILTSGCQPFCVLRARVL